MAGGNKNVFYASMLAYADSGTGGSLGSLGKGGGVTRRFLYLPYVPYGDFSNLLGQGSSILKKREYFGNKSSLLLCRDCSEQGMGLEIEREFFERVWI